MVNILIMDDKPEKIESVKKVLVDDCGISEQFIDCATTISEGRCLLSENYYELLILDLVMPLYQDDEANHDEAPNFVDEIFDNPNIKEPNQIIGLTAYDEEYDALKTRFEEKLWKLIKFSDANLNWRNPIKNSVFHLIRMKRNMMESIEAKDRYDIGIICALHEEFSILLEAFGKDKWSNKRLEGIPVPIKICSLTSVTGEEYKIVAACAGKPGMVATASLAMSLFDKTGIDKLFMTGITAGFESDSIHLCDIMIAKSAMDYASGKLVEEGIDEKKIQLLKEIQLMPANMELQSLADQLATDEEQMSKFNQHLKSVHLNGERDSKAHVTPVACGPFVVASQEAIKMIAEPDRKLRALDMEAYGLYYAAYLCQKKALWIKGVSDFANSSKGDAYHQKASYGSAYFLYLLIKEMM